MLITSRLGVFAQKKASSRRQSIDGVTHVAHFGAEKYGHCHWPGSAWGGTFRCTSATRAAVVRYSVAKSNIAAEVA